MKAIKEKITPTNLLCIFIVLCPILDMISFLFRNAFGTHQSPSTILRPLIPLTVCAYIFFIKKMKGKMILVAAIYGFYSIVHLLLFANLKTNLSYGNIALEAQHIVNYSFMIVTFFVYGVCFSNEKEESLQKSVFIAASITIICLFVSILTNTSSTTYLEGMGRKGWFESGNSLGAMLTLMLFLLFPLIHKKNGRYLVIMVIASICLFLACLIGTRVGLLGTLTALFVFSGAEIMEAILRNKQFNRYLVAGGMIALIVVVGVVIVLGSNTFARRKLLQEVSQSYMDSSTGEVAHMSQSLLALKNAIQEGKVSYDDLSKPAQESILALYDYANAHNIQSNDMRRQQLIYHLYFVKYESNPLLWFFGNGYNTSFRELVLEREIVAFLLNYGIFGFGLYFVPFLVIFIQGGYKAIRFRKQIDASYIITLFGCFFSYALGMVSSYVFFNVSTMVMIVCLHTILYKKAKQLQNLLTIEENENKRELETLNV